MNEVRSQIKKLISCKGYSRQTYTHEDCNIDEECDSYGFSLIPQSDSRHDESNYSSRDRNDDGRRKSRVLSAFQRDSNWNNPGNIGLMCRAYGLLTSDTGYGTLTSTGTSNTGSTCTTHLSRSKVDESKEIAEDTFEDECHNDYHSIAFRDSIRPPSFTYMTVREEQHKLFSDRKLAEAHRVLQKESNSSSTSSDHGSGVTTINASTGSEYLQCLNDSLHFNPRNITALLERAAAYTHMKKRDAALRDYNTVLSVDGGNVSARAALSRMGIDTSCSSSSDSRNKQSGHHDEYITGDKHDVEAGAYSYSRNLMLEGNNTTGHIKLNPRMDRIKNNNIANSSTTPSANSLLLYSDNDDDDSSSNSSSSNRSSTTSYSGSSSSSGSTGGHHAGDSIPKSKSSSYKKKKTKTKKKIKKQASIASVSKKGKKKKKEKDKAKDREKKNEKRSKKRKRKKKEKTENQVSSKKRK